MRILCSGPDPDLVMRNTGADRKKGLHLSDITKRMIYEKDRKYKPDSPIDAMILERGFTWESILEHALASRHERGGERPEQLQEDNIWMSPDWVTDDGVLEEWKATKKTSKRGFDDVSWTWMPNSMAYLRALLRRKMVDRSIIRFRIWWINGDYSYEDKNSDWHLLNDYWKVEVEFDKRELEEKWREILSNGRRYGLLKEESWRETKHRQEIAEEEPRRKKAGLPLRSSPAKARVVTFQTTKKSPRHQSA